jgi:hypothetical protein
VNLDLACDLGGGLGEDEDGQGFRRLSDPQRIGKGATVAEDRGGTKCSQE